jgi:hypothetical protein
VAGLGKGRWAGRDGPGSQVLTCCNVVVLAGRAAQQGWDFVVMLGVGVSLLHCGVPACRTAYALVSLPRIFCVHCGVQTAAGRHAAAV